MLEDLKQFIEKIPSFKQVNTLKNNKKLHEWVLNQTNHLTMSCGNVSERIYRIINPNLDISCCENTNRIFHSFNTGYSLFCGPASKCSKCRQEVSKKVSQSKQLLTDEQKIKSNKKREQTYQQKYGSDITNNSQLPGWKEHFQELYKDGSLAKQAQEKHIETMIKNHGAAHQMLLPEIVQKCKDSSIKNWGETSPMKCREVADKVVNTKSLKYPKNYLAKSWGYDTFKATLLSMYELELLCSKEEYAGSYQTHKFDMKCIKCGNIFNASATYTDKTRCKICHPREQAFCSKEECEVFNFVTNDLGLSAYQSDKSIINPFELDIVIPEKKIAIEYCGLYWHGERNNKGRLYHSRKHNLALNKGYRLITIFSDEWNLKQDITKNTLRFILGKDKNEILYAKKTHLKELNFKEVKSFLEANHLQGAGSHTSINYGLFDKDDMLVSCMTFSKPRKMLGGKNENNNKWELVRFCSSKNVAFSASKLFSHFVKTHKPNEIISYCDKRWFIGNVYENLGFTLHGCTDPGYWYSDSINRFSRTKFTKKSLVSQGFDKNKSESEIMKERNFDKVWDCGNFRFIWIKK